MSFDPTKPCRTRDGSPARVICGDRKHEVYPVIALVPSEGVEEIYTYTKEGRYRAHHDSGPDLVNVETRERWFNVYPERDSEYISDLKGYTTKIVADSHAGEDRIACIKRTIEFMPGEGL